MARLSFRLLVALVLCGCAPGARRSPSPGVWESVDRELASFQTTRGLPGLSVAVAERGEVVFAKGYGWADLERRRPVTPRTMFPIGSIEKQFTAAAILRLAERGAIALEEPITRSLPRLDTGGHVVTISDMLHQISGLRAVGGRGDAGADGTSWGPVPDAAVGEGFASREDIGSFRGQPLYFSPGERFSYSQPNYDLLCYVIASLNGKSYYEAIRELSRAAGLEAFHPEWTPRPPAEDPDGAQGYRVSDGELEVAWESNLGSAWTTPLDLTRWSRALEGGEVISRESYARMITPARLSDGRRWPYGLGLGLLTFEGRPKIVHTGRVLGFYAVLARYPDDDLTIAMMTNLGRASDIAYDLEPRVARLLMGRSAPAVRDLRLDPGQVERLVGSYDAGAFRFDVVPEGDRVALVMRLTGDGEEDPYDERTLLSQGAGVFVAEGAPEWREVRFSPDSGRAKEIALGYFAQGVRTDGR